MNCTGRLKKKAHHNDLDYFCFEIPLYDTKNINSNTYMAKSIQWAIIQAFVAL
jgi:hypothetical protein